MRLLSLPDHLLRVLDLDPSAPALEFGGRWYLWGDLSSLATELVSALEEAQVPDGGAVGLILRNDPALVAASLAVLTTQRCIVTISPHAGPER